MPDGTPVPLEQWAIPRALRGEVCTNVEYHVRRKDTGQQWIGSYNFAPIRNSMEKIVGAVTTARDITQQKKAEAALKESEERFRKFFEQHTALMMILDPETGDIIDVNNAAVDFYGWSREKSVLSKSSCRLSIKKLSDGNRINLSRAAKQEFCLSMTNRRY